jgi:glycosyltransferase involved in cell wall biosynthesis
VRFPSAPARGRAGKLALREKLLDNRERQGDVWILYLARFHSVKGQRDAAALWQQLEPGVRNRCSLIFVGPDAEKGEQDEVKRRFEGLPDRERVVFAGASQKPEEWLAAADVFLSCSKFEGMPLGPLEAIGAGLPAVLSAIEGHRFLSEFSWQYDLASPGEGARRIAEVLAEPDFGTAGYYARLWQRAAEIRETYSIESMVRSYGDLYGLQGDGKPR